MATGDWHHWNKAEIGEITFAASGEQLLMLKLLAPATTLAYLEFAGTGERKIVRTQLLLGIGKTTAASSFKLTSPGQPLIR